MAILRMERGTQAGTSYFLNDKECSIGRDASQATIVIEDQKASRCHARIFCENGQFYIEDLNSKNGTIRNGRPMTGVQKLEPGDRIQIGLSWFSFGHEEEIETIRQELQGYEVLQEIKQLGSTSLILKAKQLGLDRTVTLHLLPPSIIRANPDIESKFRQQARALSRLNHENIPIILDFEYKGTYLFYTTEFLEGETLGEALLNKGKPSIERSVEIAMACANALAYAHKQRVLHLDVTPSNVLLCARRILLGGFGIGSVLSESSGQFSGLVGKAEYLAPEQIQNANRTHSTDIYALGVLLYELLTGTPPFVAKNPEELADMIVSNSPKAMTNYNSNISGDMEDLVYQCLEKEPHDRPSSSDEVAKRLHDILIRIRLQKLRNSNEVYTSPTIFKIMSTFQHPIFAWCAFPLLSLIFLFLLRCLTR